jgi:aspartyl-tRNA(Asn)/glutamyl-tRNA(Gln) amidotransferase subunit B
VGKSFHFDRHSGVDFNRAGVPLLEIVSEPDLHSAEEVRAYATGLRSVLRYLGVNSGDLQKGVLRLEPNVSVRPRGSPILGTRVEIKNLNSFRALERGVSYEIERQINLLEQGKTVIQETVGWDASQEITVTQRVKEGEDDYRYFPEPDLPPLVIESEWIERIRASLPELPAAKYDRFRSQFGLNDYDASVLTTEPSIADYFEQVVKAASSEEVERINPKMLANWVSVELFSLLNQAGLSIEETPISPQELAGLVGLVVRGEINQNTAKNVMTEMFATGKSAQAIVAEHGWKQISDSTFIAGLVQQVLAENPEQVAEYLAGKENIARWLFGMVMRTAKGQANPQILQQELENQLQALKHI